MCYAMEGVYMNIEMEKKLEKVKEETAVLIGEWKKYKRVVTWSEEKGAWIAMAEGLPECIITGDSSVVAMDELKKDILEVVKEKTGIRGWVI